jgi:hypothetical protein
VSSATARLRAFSYGYWSTDNTNGDENVELVVATTAGIASSNGISFKRLEAPADKPGYPSVSIVRDDKGNVTAVQGTNSGMTLEKLLPALKDIIAGKSSDTQTNTPNKTSAPQDGSKTNITLVTTDLIIFRPDTAISRSAYPGGNFNEFEFDLKPALLEP